MPDEKMTVEEALAYLTSRVVGISKYDAEDEQALALIKSELERLKLENQSLTSELGAFESASGEGEMLLAAANLELERLRAENLDMKITLENSTDREFSHE